MFPLSFWAFLRNQRVPELFLEKTNVSNKVLKLPKELKRASSNKNFTIPGRDHYGKVQ